jgi:hypothetical protein
MPTCPAQLCTGTHYLSDTPEMGACPGCCTPEAMQRLDRTIAALTAPKSFSESLDELEGMVSDLRDSYREIEAERDSLAGIEAEFAERMARYLVSIGQPANPVTLEAGALRDLAVSAGLLAE